MKRLLLLISCGLITLTTYSQNFKKDPRPVSRQDDYMNEYQAGEVSTIDLLHALNSLGVRIFNCQLSPKFTQTHNLTIDVEEYLNGKLISTKNISPNDKNIYFFWDKEKQYADYISKIQFITREADSACVLSVGIMGNTTGIKLKKHLDRKAQWYSWRRFSKINWQLNTKIPLLVYSSSWYDKKSDVERSCGAVDLSQDKAETQLLLDNSLHYFLVSYRIFD